MARRGITEEDIRQVLDTGQTIEEYPDDWPFPSRLILGHSVGCALHVVAAEREDEGMVIVITAYEPDPDKWDASFRKRKSP